MEQINPIGGQRQAKLEKYVRESMPPPQWLNELHILVLKYKIVKL